MGGGVDPFALALRTGTLSGGRWITCLRSVRARWRYRRVLRFSATAPSILTVFGNISTADLHAVS
jgi:hypothetical protein